MKGKKRLTRGGVSNAGFEVGGYHMVRNGEWPLRADSDPIQELAKRLGSSFILKKMDSANSPTVFEFGSRFFPKVFR